MTKEERFKRNPGNNMQNLLDYQWNNLEQIKDWGIEKVYISGHPWGTIRWKREGDNDSELFFINIKEWRVQGRWKEDMNLRRTLLLLKAQQYINKHGTK
jgi:hypothetical protein